MFYRFTHVRGQFTGACATHVDTGKTVPDVPQTSRELFSRFQDALSSILTTRDLGEQNRESYRQYEVRGYVLRRLFSPNSPFQSFQVLDAIRGSQLSTVSGDLVSVGPHERSRGAF